MAWKIFGLLIALSVTLAVAVEQEVKSPPEQYYHGPNNPHFPALNRMTLTSEEEVKSPPEKYYHGPNNPPFTAPNNVELTSNEDLPIKKPHGNHKPHFPSSFEDSGESHEKWEHKKHNYPGWHNPHFQLHLKHPMGIPTGNPIQERRRPMFYPYLPYHFYYPHAYPSNNDDEFETIDARATINSNEESNEQLRIKWPFYYGPHHPHFPLNSDSSQENSEDVPFKPFHHHQHHHNHHGHWKPPHVIPLPDQEGSGEEEIAPLANGPKITLQEDDDQVDDLNEEQNEENDAARTSSFRNSLDLRKASIAIDCDALNTPRYSCYNCWNYLVCKPEGGKIKACKDPFQPYCNNGVCSATPSAECSNL